MTLILTTLRSLVAHKTRLALTAVSIVLGVAFISGTYVYTDTTDAAFDDVFGTSFDGVDAYISGDSGFTGGQGSYFPETVAADVAGVPGVAAAAPGIRVPGVTVVGTDGAPIGGGGAPQFGASLPEPAAGEVASAFALRIGRTPEGPDEVVVDVATAEAGGFALGDTIVITSAASPAGEFTLVGIAGFGQADDLAGATFALFDLPTVQTLTGHEGQLSEIYVRVEPGGDVATVIADLGSALPTGVRVQSAQTAAEEQAGEFQDAMGFFTNFLLVFAFIALFVGSFIIYNTFRIVVNQRMRELALMRALGSTRGQVVGTVLLEAVLVGLASSVVGVGAGLGLAVGLRWILDAVGIGLPTGSLILAPRTVVIGLLVGVVVTALSALFPAIAASRIPPVAAMRADEVPVRRRSEGVRTLVGGSVLVAGAAFVGVGLSRDSATTTAVLTWVGLGALVMVLGVYVLSALLARPAAALIGAPLARFAGVAGQLARRNAGRSPRRTSATAAAIMIGIALITMASTLSSSLQSAVDDIFATGVDAELVVTPTDQVSLTGFPHELAVRAAALPEVAAVSRLQIGPVLLDGEQTTVAGLQANYADFFTVDDVAGSLELGRGDLMAGTDYARERGWSLGDPVVLTFEDRGTQTFILSATFHSDGLDGIVIGEQDYAEFIGGSADQQVFIQLTDGVTPADGRDAVAAAATDIPSAVVQTSQERVDAVSEQVGNLLGLVTGLLGMTVLVALIGVTNTMALAVFERRREIGLLRAVGLDRPQTRRMIRLEASIIATFGAALGVVLGLFLGWAVVRALAAQGLQAFVVPWPALAGWVLGTAVLGVLFSVWPARRAARLDVLAAIAYQ